MAYPASRRPYACVLATLLSLAAASAAAQTTYRWIDPTTGRTMITDTPPPGGARQVSRAGPGQRAADSPELPYATRRAAQLFPVTLYSSANCPPCDEARALLIQRGIPFTEKIMRSEADMDELKALVGDTAVPILLIGRQTLKGFEAGSIGKALDLAGYPAAPTTTGERR